MTTILAIDDNESNLITLKSVLEEYIDDCKVITLNSAINCIDYARKHNPDAILLDVIMPDIDGYDACRMLKTDTETENIPIILLTALMTDTKSKIKGLDAGAEAFLPKPFDTSELIAQTKAMVRIKQAESLLKQKKEMLEKEVTYQAEQLDQTNRDYKSILESLGEGVGNLNSKNEFIYINKAGTEIFGYPKTELLGQKLKNILTEDMYKLVLEQTTNKSINGNRSNFYLNISTKAGKKKILKVVAMAEFDESGEYQGSSGVFSDVTKSIHDEQLLKFQFDLAKTCSATNEETVVLNALLKFASKGEEFDCGGVYISNKTKNNFELVSSIGFGKEFDNKFKNIKSEKVDANFTKEKTTHFNCLNEILEDENSDQITNENIKANLVKSIRVSDKTSALLILGSRKLSQFSKESQQTVNFLVEQVKSAIARIEAEKAHHESIERYHSIFEGTKDAILTIKKGLISDCNDALVKMLEYQSKEDIIGKSPLFFSPNFNIGDSNPTQRGIEAINNTIKSGFNQFEWILKKANGSIFWAEARMSLFTINNSRYISVILKDLTDRRKQDEEIRKFKAITEAANYGCMISDLDNKIIYCNQAFAEMHEFKIEELLNKKQNFLFDKKQKLQNDFLINEIKEKGHFTSIETWHKAKSGNIFPCLENGIVIKDEFNNPLYYSSTVVNISTIKNYERELKTALEKANESDTIKASFLASISHELRTPLNAVIGFSQLLDKGLNQEEVAIYANLIFESGIHLQEIVEDIFYFTMVRSGQEKPNYLKMDVDLLWNDIMKMGIDIQKGLERHDLKLLFDKNEFPGIRFITDKQKVMHLFKLLIKNAFKFTLKGEISLSHQIIKNEIIFTIKDTGIGIPEDKKDIVFNFFRQADETLARKYEGTGIGLAIAKSLCLMLEGKIWFESEIDIGSTFYFKLPLKPSI